MLEQPWLWTAITALSPIAIALLSAEASKSFSPRKRLEKQIRTLSELINDAGTETSAAGLRSAREHTTALYVSRVLVRGYPLRVLFATLAAIAGLIFLVAGLLVGSADSQIIGLAYVLLGGVLLGRVSLRTKAFRNRTYRALRAGRPSAHVALDTDLTPARNVRGARKIRARGATRARN